MNIWVRIDHIQYVQQPIRVVDVAQAPELHSSFPHHGGDYSRGLSGIAVQPDLEQLDPFNILDNEEKPMIPFDD